MRTKIIGGSILTPWQELRDHQMIIEDGIVAGIQPASDSAADFDDVINAAGRWITPGMVDIHIHGAAGSDTMDASPEAFRQIGRFLVEHGVTAYLPTTMTAAGEDVSKAIKQAGGFSDPEGARILGVHLEGPYLNPEHKGAQALDYLRPAQQYEYADWLQQENVRLMTVAPEMEGVSELIAAGREWGIVFAAGHSSASYEQMQKAIELGLTQATHTFNAMPGLHHRKPGILGSVLTDERVFAQVIADGIHLHPAIVKLIIKAKGIERSVLISDSIRASGLDDGEYDLGGQMVQVRDGIANVHQEDGSIQLAGSTLTLDQAVRNTMAFTDLPFNQIIRMATAVPALSIRMEAVAGHIEVGRPADLVIWDRNASIIRVLLNGRTAYISGDNRK